MSREQKENTEIAELGRKIRQARKAKNISLADAAKRAGISAAFLNKVENGISCPSAVILARLATVISEDINDLVSHVKTIEQQFDEVWSALDEKKRQDMKILENYPGLFCFEAKRLFLEALAYRQSKGEDHD